MNTAEPLFVVGPADRTRGGSLPIRTLEMLSSLLVNGGYVLLPSDTAYALATLAVSAGAQPTINKILDRPNWPLSIAFPSVTAARRWITRTVTADVLFERFCPGPITIVCKANPNLPANLFSEAISSPRTIGVRISDSVVEREVAACSAYPITTVAIREPGGGNIITSFESALAVVKKGMRRIGSLQWAAIEALDGEIVYSAHSTVVRVRESGAVELIRDGDIPFSKILDAIKFLPIERHQ